MSNELVASRPIRWWPAIGILVLTFGFIAVTQSLEELPFQLRNMRSMGACIIAYVLLLIWWLAFSRARWKLRLGAFVCFHALLGAGAAAFRIKGVSGDLIPIFEPRWVKAPVPPAATQAMETKTPTGSKLERPSTVRPDFPQFLGPDRTGMLVGPALDPDWVAHPPKVLWRQPVGAAWSGFVVVADRVLTQEQHGNSESVTCRELLSGRLLWTHSDEARYFTPIAGEGPRATPTVVSNRVYALGATGRLNCLELDTGKPIWSRSIVEDAGAKMPEWGYSGSPLHWKDRVVVSAGGKDGKSLLAYHAGSGEVAWSAGDSSAGYGSPFLATLAGKPQFLLFNSGRITAHDPESGNVLWEHPWGVGMPHVAAPVVTGSDTVLFSSGYGVGSELLQVSVHTNQLWKVEKRWASKKMKAKFATLVRSEGFVYGLDDGMLACLDLKDGSQRWKEGRYGHGQGLLVGDLYLLMSESGELVLLRPTPEGPGELQRLKVFDSKTWNPIALSGEILLVRNDQEAVCFELALRR